MLEPWDNECDLRSRSRYDNAILRAVPLNYDSAIGEAESSMRLLRGEISSSWVFALTSVSPSRPFLWRQRRIYKYLRSSSAELQGRQKICIEIRGFVGLERNFDRNSHPRKTGDGSGWGKAHPDAVLLNDPTFYPDVVFSIGCSQGVVESDTFPLLCERWIVTYLCQILL